MKSVLCLLVTLAVAYGAVLPFKPNCLAVLCAGGAVCADGTPAPTPAWSCCPSVLACKGFLENLMSINDCANVMCTMDVKICPDGSRAPVPVGGCCPSLSACKSNGLLSRSNPLGSLGSLLSGSNLLQSLSTATHGTDLGTIISIVNLLNNVHQLSNDIHQIPVAINQTIAAILNTTGQASQHVIDQLVGVISAHQNAGSRNLLGTLGQNANLLSSISHLLPQGTSISTILSILNLLNNVNALNNDIHQIPVLLNQTLASIVGGAGQATQLVVDQLLSLITPHASTSRDLLGALGQNANLLSTISHLLPQGTSISTVLSLLNLLNNVNALNNDLHQIPAVLQETIQNILNGVQNILPSASL